MPPLSTSPPMLDLGVYLPMPEEIVLSGTCDGSASPEIRGVLPYLDARRRSSASPTEYIGAALALRTLAHIGRLKREGRELRRKRLAAGMSKGLAARLCGVSARQVHRWESGEREVPGWVWQRILGDTSASLRPACSSSMEPLRVSTLRSSPAIAKE